MYCYKRNLYFKTFVIVLLQFFFVQSSYCWALEKSQIPIRRFHVTQEKYHKGGVYVIRPKPLDIKILNIMNLNKIHSLEDYAKWLRENIKYKKDGLVDDWSTPKETLFKKNGDCEDYAFLNAYVLLMLGYEPRFMALQRPGGAHAICVFKVDGYYFWFDNTKLNRTNAQTIKEFAKHIMIQYDYFQLFELDLQTKVWNLLFVRS